MKVIKQEFVSKLRASIKEEEMKMSSQIGLIRIQILAQKISKDPLYKEMSDA